MEQRGDLPRSVEALSRRVFCTAAARVGLGATLLRGTTVRSQGASGVHFSVAEFERLRILKTAAAALTEGPVSLVQVRVPGKQPEQMYYEEKSTAETPAPFTRHRGLLNRFNRNLCALTAAWRLTKEPRYLAAALQQLHTWCVDSATRMLPQFEMAGIVPGMQDDRNNGMTSTVAIASIARAASFVCVAPDLPEEDVSAIRGWFAELLRWFVDSRKGRIAQQTKSLEAICWTMQAAELARFNRDDAQLRSCTHLFRDGLLRQMHFDGYFPLALPGPNPFATSMFTLECMASTCESLFTPFESLWNATLPDGRGMHSAVAWALPFLRDLGKWPYLADRDDFKNEPVRQSALLFAGRAYDQPDYIEVWKRLPAEMRVDTMETEHPIAQPALWTTRPPG